MHWNVRLARAELGVNGKTTAIVCIVHLCIWILKKLLSINGLYHLVGLSTRLHVILVNGIAGEIWRIWPLWCILKVEVLVLHAKRHIRVCIWLS